MSTQSPRFAFRGSEILARVGPEGPIEVQTLDSAEAEFPGVAELAESMVFRSGMMAGLYSAGSPAPDGWEWRPFRQVIGALPENEWLDAARAMAFVHWRASTRFCGRCGSPNGNKTDEIARVCPSCGAMSFPRISPAVLAAVRKGDRLLLARNAANKTGTWSILAGFVEPGETFEGCVRREVLEEVSVEVEPRGYFGSQSWPFPDQLMVGFAVDWKAGELKPDGVEIAEAGWFGPDDHPTLPMHGSLSRRLIDATFADISRAGTRR